MGDFRPFGRITLTIVSTWALLVACGYLRSIEKYVLWYGSILLVLVLGRHYRRIPWATIKWVTVGGGLLVIAVACTVFTGEQPAHSLLEAGKFAAIFLVLAPLLATSTSLGAALLLGIELATYLNCALVLFWWATGIQTVVVMGPGRYGTLLAGPGSLWRIGAASLVWSTLRYLKAGPLNLRNLAALFAAVSMFLIDGARTGVLAFALAGIVTFGYLATQRQRWGRLLASAAVLTGLLGIVLWRVGADRDPAAFLRALVGANSLLSGDGGAFIHDDVREGMANEVFAEIESHPITGRGMGMTRSPLAGGGYIVNHFSYLQMWADTGLLGFVSYVALNIGLAAQGVHRLCKSARRMSGGRACAAFTGVYLLLCWAMACVFHAVSTELTEWLMYLAGLALVSNLLRSPLDNRDRLARLTL